VRKRALTCEIALGTWGDVAVLGCGGVLARARQPSTGLTDTVCRDMCRTDKSCADRGLNVVEGQY